MAKTSLVWIGTQDNAILDEEEPHSETPLSRFEVDFQHFETGHELSLELPDVPLLSEPSPVVRPVLFDLWEEQESFSEDEAEDEEDVLTFVSAWREKTQGDIDS